MYIALVNERMLTSHKNIPNCTLALTNEHVFPSLRGNKVKRAAGERKKTQLITCTLANPRSHSPEKHQPKITLM